MKTFSGWMKHAFSLFGGAMTDQKKIKVSGKITYVPFDVLAGLTSHIDVAGHDGTRTANALWQWEKLAMLTHANATGIKNPLHGEASGYFSGIFVAMNLQKEQSVIAVHTEHLRALYAQRETLRAMGKHYQIKSQPDFKNVYLLTFNDTAMIGVMAEDWTQECKDIMLFRDKFVTFMEDSVLPSLRYAPQQDRPSYISVGMPGRNRHYRR